MTIGKTIALTKRTLVSKVMSLFTFYQQEVFFRCCPGVLLNSEGRVRKKSGTGSPVLKTLSFHCRGSGLSPGWGTRIPYTMRKKKKKKQGTNWWGPEKTRAWRCAWERFKHHFRGKACGTSGPIRWRIEGEPEDWCLRKNRVGEKTNLIWDILSVGNLWTSRDKIRPLSLPLSPHP